MTRIINLGDGTYNANIEGDNVIKEGQVLDLPFEQLDADLQLRIREFGEQKYFPNSNPDSDEQDFPVSLNQLKEDYESSWQSD